MPIAVACPGCGRKSQAPDAAAGKRAKCPGCGQILTIPRPAPVAARPSAAMSDLDRLMAADAASVPGAPLGPATKKKKRGSNTRLLVILAGGAGAVLIVLLLVALFWPSGGGSSPSTATTGTTSAPTPTDDPAPPASDPLPAAPGTPSAASSPAVGGARMPAFPDAMTAPPDWLLKDTPFDVAAYFAAPPPEENAAPLYLDALYEFSPDVAPCFSEDEQTRRTPVVAARAERFGNLFAAWQKDPKSVDPAAVDAVLAALDVGFQKLAKAQERKECVFQTGMGLDVEISPFAPARNVARACQMRVARSLAKGNVDPALSEMEIVFRFSRGLGVRGTTLAQLVRIAIDGTLYQLVIPTVLARPEITMAQCDRLGTMLAQQEQASDVFLACAQSEYIMARLLLHDLETHREPFAPDAPAGEDSPKEALEAALEKMSPAMLRQKGVEILGEWYRSMAQAARGGLAERIEADQRFVKDAKAKNSAWAPTLVGNLGVVAQVIARNQAFLRGTRCLVALRRWEVEKGGPAGDLEAAARAAGMEGVPEDPFGDGPLRMTTIDGRPVVYSVGLDGDDDGGRVEWNLDPNAPDGDVLFRLPQPGE
ncbi:MAG: hypothetical protein JW809_09360 [Pirellulales bacterium]|nr:hypothetical protein [Pirellulales bacterium]